MDSPIPSLETVLSSSPESTSPLATTLSVLFEPSPILFDRLVPELANSFASGSKVDSYTSLIDRAIGVIDAWDDQQKAQFVTGHPRIGENQHISTLSANEQGASSASIKTASTPPEVLERLAELNARYEKIYPGLRYITFVNGRSRAEIAQEIEGVLSSKQESVEVGGDQWTRELNRAVADVGRIAKSRLNKLGIQ